MTKDGHIKKHSIKSALCMNCAYRSRCVVNKISSHEFNTLSESVISRISLKKGQFLYKRGDSFAKVYALRFGAIKSELVFNEGISQVTHFFVPGDVLGLDGIGNGKQQLDSICLNSVEVCYIPMLEVHKMIKAYPDLMGNVASALGSMLNFSYAHNYDLMHLHSLERLAEFLTHYSNRVSTAGSDQDEFILPMSRPDLANYLGMAVETLSRSIAQLEEIGAISAVNRRIKFLSRKSIFKLINSMTAREKDESIETKIRSYPAFTEKRKP